jgi:cytidylate kinase
MTPSRFRVVTVAREYGSGGAAVAARLASRLGFQLLDRALIQRIAERAQVDSSVAARLDEHLDPWVQRIGRALWRGGFEAVAPVDENEVLDAERLAVLSGRVIHEAAAVGGCVIVGRGSQCVLRGRDDVFHVFVYGPREERLARLRARLAAGTDLEAALEDTDRERTAYVRRNYGENWLDPRLYHLMVNSALGEDAVVATVLAALAPGAPGPA